MPRLPRIPVYRHHKPTGQASVRIAGKDYYLGRYGTEESRRAYARLIAETTRPGGGSQPPVAADTGLPDLSVNELFVRYLAYAQTYYVQDGKPTDEVANLKDAMRSVRALYETQRAAAFGPLCLKAVRQYMIDTQKLSRKVINRVVGPGCYQWPVLGCIQGSGMACIRHLGR